MHNNYVYIKIPSYLLLILNNQNLFLVHDDLVFVLLYYYFLYLSINKYQAQDLILILIQ
jgi:hypothetical protein